MNDIEFLKIGLAKEELGDNHLDKKKELNPILAQSRKRAKKDKCIYCNEEKTSFCNSHSIPAFCLKNIATDGYLYYSNTLIDVALLDSEKGVKNAGIFQLICRDCDSKIFQEYEDLSNYEKAKRLSQKNWKGEYYQFYYEKLDYVVPVAF